MKKISKTSFLILNQPYYLTSSNFVIVVDNRPAPVKKTSPSRIYTLNLQEKKYVWSLYSHEPKIPNI